MKARDIMTTDRIEAVTPGDSLQDAARRMRDADVGSLPVVDDLRSMHLVGLITDRDITIRHVAADHTADCRVGDHMTKGRLHTVSPDDDVTAVTSRMKAEQVRRIPVVEDDRLIGIIAQADIATENVGDRETGEVVEKISEPTR